MHSLTERHPMSQPRGLQRALVWSWPDLNIASFLGLSILCILNVNEVVRVLFGVSRAASGLIFLLCLACILTARVPLTRALGSLGFLFFAFFAYYLVVSGIIGLDVEDMFFYFQQLLGTIVVAVAAIMVGWRQAHRPKLDTVMLLFFGVWLLSVIGIFFSAHLRESTAEFGTAVRDSGFFTNPNHAGSVAAIAFAIGFALLRTGRHTVLLWLCLAVTAVGSLRTFSKMSMLMIMSVALMQLTLSGSTIKNRVQIFLSSITVLAAVFWLLNFGIDMFDWKAEQLQRLLEIREIIYNLDINDKTTTARTFLFKVGLKKFFEAPFFGQGLGTFHTMPEAMGLGTHNNYLMVAGEAGIFALMLLIFFIFRLAKSALACDYPMLRQFCINYTLVFTMAGLSSHAVFSHRFHNLMIGLTIGLLIGRMDYAHQLRRQAATATDHGLPPQLPNRPGRFSLRPARSA